MSWNGWPLETIVANRRRYFEKMGLNIGTAISADQVHGIRVAIVGKDDAGRGMLDPASRIASSDALVSNQSNLILTTLHADCAPVYFFDPVGQATGLAHAGWRGVLGGIVGQVVQTLKVEFGTLPERLLADIGPTISAGHFEVGADVAHQFSRRFSDSVCFKQGGHHFVDLVGAIRLDLAEAGVRMDLGTMCPPCTFASPEFASYRRDGHPVASMMAWITLSEV